MSTLRLAADLRAQIAREAHAAFPRECCGLIEGRRTGIGITAEVIHATRNAIGEADRFEVDPADHFRILREARGRGAEIVGCYHSHPNGKPAPSVRDREGANQEGFVWLIAALMDRGHLDLTAYLVRSGQFVPITIATA